MAVTYSATIPTTNATTLSGAFKAAAAPDGEGVDIQIALYNLPTGGNLSASFTLAQFLVSLTIGLTTAYGNPHWQRLPQEVTARILVASSTPLEESLVQNASLIRLRARLAISATNTAR